MKYVTALATLAALIVAAGANGGTRTADDPPIGVTVPGNVCTVCTHDRVPPPVGRSGWTWD